MTMFRCEKRFLKFIIILLNITTLFFSSIESFAFVDITKPIVSNLQLSSTDVKPGDTIELTMEISDESLADSHAYVSFSSPESQTRFWVDLNYDEVRNLLVGSFVVDSRMANGVWEFMWTEVYDGAGNLNSNSDFQDISFQVTGSRDPRMEGQLIVDLEIDKTIVQYGESINFTASVNFETSNDYSLVFFLQSPELSLFN